MSERRSNRDEGANDWIEDGLNDDDYLEAGDDVDERDGEDMHALSVDGERREREDDVIGGDVDLQNDDDDDDDDDGGGGGDDGGGGGDGGGGDDDDDDDDDDANHDYVHENENDGDEHKNSSNNQEDNGSSGQSDIEMWHAQVFPSTSVLAASNHCFTQDGIDFSPLSQLKQPVAASCCDDDTALSVSEINTAAAALQQEAYNKEFERAALFEVLMRETPRPDDEATGLFK
jgi:hypothetical protein